MLTTLNKYYKYAIFVCYSILLYLCINIRKYLQQMHIKRNYIKKEKNNIRLFKILNIQNFDRILLSK